MQISAKAAYSLRLMIHLALNYKQTCLTIRDIAGKEDISEKYLCPLANTLRAAGLIISSRGPKGGYSLAKSPDRITLLDIIQASQGKLDLLANHDRSPLNVSETGFIANKFWNASSLMMRKYFASCSLSEIVSEYDGLSQEYESHLLIADLAGL